MKVYLDTGRNRVKHILHLSPKDTIGELRDKWRSIHAARSEAKGLVFGGRQLADHETLEQSGIRENSTISTHRLMGAIHLLRKLECGPLKVECNVCFKKTVRKKLVSLEPCGHAKICKHCAYMIQQCPECRVPVTEVLPAGRPKKRRQGTEPMARKLQK